jgi:hypothetical protein
MSFLVEGEAAALSEETLASLAEIEGFLTPPPPIEITAITSAAEADIIITEAIEATEAAAAEALTESRLMLQVDVEAAATAAEAELPASIRELNPMSGTYRADVLDRIVENYDMLPAPAGAEAAIQAAADLVATYEKVMTGTGEIMEKLQSTMENVSESSSILEKKAAVAEALEKEAAAGSAEVEAQAKAQDRKNGKQEGSTMKSLKKVMMFTTLAAIGAAIAFAFLKHEADEESGCFWFYGGVQQNKIMTENDQNIADGWCNCSYGRHGNDIFVSSSKDCTYTKNAGRGEIIPHCVGDNITGGSNFPSQLTPGTDTTNPIFGPNNEAIGKYAPWCTGSPSSPNSITYYHVVQTPLGVLSDAVKTAVDIATSPADILLKTIKAWAIRIGLMFLVILALYIGFKFFMVALKKSSKIGAPAVAAPSAPSASSFGFYKR